MRDFRVTVCQVDIEWHAKEANLQRYAELISDLKGKTDLIIFPETFTTGFSMKAPELAEDLSGPTADWLKNQARTLNAALVASFLCMDGEKLHNRFIWAHPDGTIDHYDKRHLFTFANEDEHFTAGKEKKLIGYAGWTFMPQVCYDLRFPVFSRNSNGARYDVLVYVANWPAARSSAWRSLLVARAHENQCYVIGVNRVGVDGIGVNCKGNSMVIGPKGDIIAQLNGTEQVRTVTLSWDGLEQFRDKFRPLNDADEFELKL